MLKLFRYTDKTTGEERGISYSDKDGNSPINNPEWDCVEIQDKDKQQYLDLHTQQRNAKIPKPVSEKERIMTALGITDEHLAKLKAFA